MTAKLRPWRNIFARISPIKVRGPMSKTLCTKHAMPHERGLVQRRPINRRLPAPACGQPMKLNVNKQTHDVDADPRTPLLYVLRGDLKLHAAKFGCGLRQCGAC